MRSYLVHSTGAKHDFHESVAAEAFNRLEITQCILPGFGNDRTTERTCHTAFTQAKIDSSGTPRPVTVYQRMVYLFYTPTARVLPEKGVHIAQRSRSLCQYQATRGVLVQSVSQFQEVTSGTCVSQNLYDATAKARTAMDRNPWGLIEDKQIGIFIKHGDGQ
jgi:hypothetical protein